MKHSAKSLFLLDGLGALTTALLLSQVLARFEAAFGMPKNVLFILSGIACCFAVYSLTCHFFIKDTFKPFLKGIMAANVAYSLLTLGLVGFFFQSLSLLGIAYFIGEILIILILVLAEHERVKNSSS